MSRKWWTFDGFAKEKVEDLKKRFLATCDHEGGHTLMAGDLAPEALRPVRVDEPKLGKVFEGVTGVHIPSVKVTEYLIPIALAGCMAEAKRETERLYGREALFPQRDLELSLNMLWGHLGNVHPDKPNELLYVPFPFTLEDGSSVAGRGYATAADLLEIPPEMLLDDTPLSSGLVWAASYLNLSENWTRTCRMADALAKYPGRTFAPAECLDIIRR